MHLSSSALIQHSHWTSSLSRNLLCKTAPEQQRMSRECLKDFGISGCPHCLLALTFPYCGHFIRHCFYLLRHRQTCMFQIQRSGRSAKSRTLCSSVFEPFKASILSSSPQGGKLVAGLCACLGEVGGNADKLVGSRIWRFKKGTQ